MVTPTEETMAWNTLIDDQIWASITRAAQDPGRPR